MSYICEFCGARPENCACSIDLSEPRLETELAVADNIMAVENPLIKRPYGLLDAPSPADFFSLLVEMEKEELKYDTPPSTSGRTSTINLPLPPSSEVPTQVSISSVLNHFVGNCSSVVCSSFGMISL